MVKLGTEVNSGRKQKQKYSKNPLTQTRPTDSVLKGQELLKAHKFSHTL